MCEECESLTPFLYQVWEKPVALTPPLTMQVSRMCMPMCAILLFGSRASMTGGSATQLNRVELGAREVGRVEERTGEKEGGLKEEGKNARKNEGREERREAEREEWVEERRERGKKGKRKEGKEEKGERGKGEKKRAREGGTWSEEKRESGVKKGLRDEGRNWEKVKEGRKYSSKFLS